MFDPLSQVLSARYKRRLERDVGAAGAAGAAGATGGGGAADDDADTAEGNAVGAPPLARRGASFSV